MSGAVARDMLVELLETNRRPAIGHQASEITHQVNDGALEVAALGDPVRRRAVCRRVVHHLDQRMARPPLALQVLDHPPPALRLGDGREPGRIGRRRRWNMLDGADRPGHGRGW